jgi:hypothetical protein
MTNSFDTDFGPGVSELASRSSNGIDVALLWRPCDNSTVVAVVDHGTREAFVLDVDEGDNPLDIFHHPYAYAARREIEHEVHADHELIRIAA